VLSKRYKVITVDARGHGRSDKPAGPYRVGQFAADTAGFIRMMKTGPLHVVGLSMGGVIAFQLAVDAPDLVRSLCIVNAGPELLLPRLKDKLMLHTRLFIVRFLGMRMVGRKLAGEMFPHKHQAEFRRKLIDRWADNDKYAYLDTVYALVGWSVADQIGKITCPVLVIRGEFDDTPLEVSDAQLARMPNAKKVVVKDSRHATPVDQIDEFNRLLMEFLKSMEPAG
jgi:3-oxoadipate enol-lactonase